MGRRQVIGLSWIAVAAASAAVTLTFRDDSAQIIVTLVLAVVTAGFGAWVVVRGGAGSMQASVIAAIAWVAVYGILAILQAGEVTALVTDVFLAVIGAALGLVAWRSRLSGTPVEADPGVAPSRGH